MARGRRSWSVRALAAFDVLALVVGLFLVVGRSWVGGVSRRQAIGHYRDSVGSGVLDPPASTVANGLPAPGVYRYKTAGGERLSLFGIHRTYSGTTMRVVTSLPGCGVRERQYFLVQHVDQYDRCGDVLVAYGTDLAYYFTHHQHTYVCQGGSFDMGDARPGVTTTWSCGDKATQTRETTRYVADETVSVGGFDVAARHTQRVTVFSGATLGRAVVDDWFDSGTGLVLREHREVGLRFGSPFGGHITYTDKSEMTVLSLEPDR